MVSECSVPSTKAPISRMSRSNSANAYHFEINICFLRNFIPLRIKGFIGSKKMVLNSSDQKIVKEMFGLPSPSPV